MPRDHANHAAPAVTPPARPSTTPPGNLVTLPDSPDIPDYLRDTYHWAYLSRVGRAVFDRPAMVSAILWGNARRLMGDAAAEFAAGSRVLQTACVYGDFSLQLAERVGPQGRLDVIDVAPIQVANCRRKLAAYPQVRLRVADTAAHEGKGYDGVCCFFLLHEVPEDYKHRIVDRVLGSLRPGGKAVFVDYHEPRRWHPLRGIMSLVFRWLEPYARALWRQEIASYATRAGDFTWTKRTYFGGLYQKTVAIREAA
jgi:ubiquinone/menaquinone biosynthesis C-methylase UbiE